MLRPRWTTTSRQRPTPSNIVLLTISILLVTTTLISAQDTTTAAAATKTPEELSEEEARSPFASLQSTTKSFPGVYSSISPVHDPALCPKHGCSNLPRDIAYDKDAKDVLNDVRTTPAGPNAATPLSTIGDGNRATLTLIGYKGGDSSTQINQDRAFVLSPFVLDGANADAATTRLLGVFDGHGPGGEFVSDHAVTNIPSLLADKLGALPEDDDDEESVKRILHDAYLQLDRSAPPFVTGGCTASTVLQLSSTIYIANAGDSRSFIATYRPATSTTTVVYVTREDKPDLPEEKARVEEMGGRVKLKTRPGGTSRVMYVDRESAREYGLAMSRSLGDWDAGKVGVIPDPIVDVVHLEEVRKGGKDDEVCTATAEGQEECADVSSGDDDGLEVFAVSATDGLLDYITVQNIAEHVAKGLYDPDGPHLFSACQELIGSAANGWSDKNGGRYRDDIAIAVSRLV